MGRLYAILQEINRLIDEKKLDPRITRGRIALKAGVPLAFTESTPDDPAKAEKIISAAKEILGANINA